MGSKPGMPQGGPWQAKNLEEDQCVSLMQQYNIISIILP